MDLGAYSNIELLKELVDKNNIEVPRLRGYRLMKYENPIDYKEMFNDCENKSLEDIITAIPRFSINSSETRKLVRYYYKNGEINWNLIHGKFRRNLKYLIKINKRRIKDQYEMFNKYCGRDDVLYIHARVGGANWNYYDCDNLVKSKDWFLDKIDDSYDCTYCDIYAKLKIKE